MSWNFNKKFYIYGEDNLQIPLHLNFGKFILDQLSLYKNKTALINAGSGETKSYEDLANYAVKVAIILKNLGVKHGDVVGVGSDLRLDTKATMLGVLLVGATVTPFEMDIGRSILTHKLTLLKPKYLLFSKIFWSKYEDILTSHHSLENVICLDEDARFPNTIKKLEKHNFGAEVFEPVEVKGQDDLAFILTSSGTTGLPKGVMLTHLNCIINSAPDNFRDESLQNSYVYGWWSHNYELFISFKLLALGKTIVFLPSPFNYKSILETFDKYDINLALLSPSFLMSLLKYPEVFEGRSLQSVKWIYCRSAPLHINTVKQIRERFPSIEHVLQGYGMTEAGELTSECCGKKGLKPGSVGMASPGIILKIADLETDACLGTNQRGEICVKGPVIMKGYIGADKPEDHYFDKEGFLRTGDLGYYDEDKYVYIFDRIKDIINVGGCNVAPLELETIIMTHPDVIDVAVIGKPDPTLEEVPTAFVVRKENSTVTEEDIINYVSKEVTEYMTLAGGVIFTNEIPRNPRKKIMRSKLRSELI